MGPKKTSKLAAREWVAILSVLSFFAFFAIISKSSQIHSKKIVTKFPRPSSHHIQVTLTGAVKSPGLYECQAGTPLRELIKKVGLSPNADRKKAPLKKILYSSKEIEIPRKSSSEKISLEEK